MQRHYGVRELPKLQVHGCTDFGIWTALFEQLGIPLRDGNGMADLIQEYCEVLVSSLNEFSGEVLPGVVDCMQALQADSKVATGLLTGNAEYAAEIKMEHFGLGKYVDDFGGFGDIDADRNAVARRALESASAFLGPKFDAAKVLVIGDTVRDITCARSIGAKVVAVETGGDDRDTLKSALPDVQVVNLTNFDLLEALAGF